MKQKQGSGLIITVVLLFVILAMVVTLSSVTVLETKMSQKTKSSVGAFYNSESGVEWALNQISTKSGSINSVFSGIDLASGKKACPDFGSGASPCDLYFLDAEGNVINNSNATVPPTSDISLVKAVRSVGTQNTGEVTQRAIEAAVAAGGGICYTDYSLADGLSVGSPCSASGFTIKVSLGKWGMCGGGSSCPGCAGPTAYYLPPGGSCTSHPSVGSYSPSYAGTAYLCCQ